MHEGAQRLSSNQDFINIMRVVCKVSGWNTVLPDRVEVVERTIVDGKPHKEVITKEVVADSTLQKYNGKREVWFTIRNLLNLSPDTMAKIEYGSDDSQEIRFE